MIGQCLHEIVTSYGLVLSLFFAGLAGGFSHCVFMCSPFILAQTSNKTKESTSSLALVKLKESMLIPYHLGRITTYTLLAVVLNTIVNLAFLFQPERAILTVPMLLTAAIIFLVSAFPQTAVLFPWAGRIKISLPTKWISHIYGSLVKNPGFFKRFLLGGLLGFIPCGLVVSALMASATAPSIYESALAMASFGIGTVPALVVTALGVNILKDTPIWGMKRIRQGGMVISALWLFILAGSLIL